LNSAERFVVGPGDVVHGEGLELLACLEAEHPLGPRLIGEERDLLVEAQLLLLGDRKRLALAARRRRLLGLSTGSRRPRRPAAPRAG
jgi:hypothetical protein